MSIFDKDRVGLAVRCCVEKNGKESVGYVKWTHAIVGVVTAMKIAGLVQTTGWTVLEVDPVI